MRKKKTITKKRNKTELNNRNKRDFVVTFLCCAPCLLQLLLRAPYLVSSSFARGPVSPMCHRPVFVLITVPFPPGLCYCPLIPSFWSFYRFYFLAPSPAPPLYVPHYVLPCSRPFDLLSLCKCAVTSSPFANVMFHVHASCPLFFWLYLFTQHTLMVF